MVSLRNTCSRCSFDWPIGGRWFISAAHHDLHHTHVRCNYGLYFRVWDKLMGTDRLEADYPFMRPAIYDHAERWRRWESCFTLDFSYIHGGSVRTSSKSRYRQWMTHKLAHWIDQFGTSGCVGCGRCITWCPVGIDITEEVAAIRAHDATREGRT